MTSEIVFITDEQVQQNLSVPKSVELAREAYGKLALKAALNPERAWFTVPNGASLYCMPCHVIGQDTCSVKIARSNPENRNLSLPSVLATLYVYDSTTGVELAQIAAETLTALRTAASSALATELLSRRDSKVLGIIGTGRVGEAHVSAIREVRKISEILAYSRNRTRLETFANTMSEKHGIPAFPAESAEEVVRSSDILVLATTSQTPLFSGRIVRPGTHINAVGTSLPETREVDTRLVQYSKVFVDSRQQALSSYGDIIIPLKERAIQEKHVRELPELLLSPGFYERSDGDITLFKAGGVAVLDAVAADYLVSQIAGKKPSPAT